MAITGDKSTTLAAPASSTYKYTLRAFFEEQGTDTTNNTSKIYVEASLAASKIAFDNNKGGTLSIYWHDNNTNTDTLVASLNVKQCGKTYGTKWIGATIYPTHKSDGTLSGYAIAKWEKLVSNNYIPASGSVSTDNTALTNIPRQATADSVAGFTDEQNPVLRYTNNAGNAVTTLQACIALTESSAATNPAIAWRDISKTGNSYTFNLTTAERETLQNNTSGQSRNLWFFVKTVLNGTTYYSYKIATMTIVNANPTMDAPTYSDTNATTTAVTQDNQKIIQNKSTLQFQFANIEALKGATLSKISMTINGVTKEKTLSGTSVASTTYDFGTIDVAENTTATIVLTDSRGFTKSYTKQISVLEYFQPNAIISVNREANFYTESHITVDANYASLNGSNTITIQYRIKKSTDQNWGNWTTIQDNVEADFNADNQYMWDLQVQLTDILGTTTTYNAPGALDVGIPLVFYDVKKRSVGVNTMPNNAASLEVDDIDLRNIYSTTEQKVGTWIDGKPIYRKVITHTISDTTATSETIATNISNMETIINASGTGSYTAGGTNKITIPLAFYNSGGWNSFHIVQNGTNITYQKAANYPVIDLIFILEYTKTID